MTTTLKSVSVSNIHREKIIAVFGFFFHTQFLDSCEVKACMNHVNWVTMLHTVHVYWLFLNAFSFFLQITYPRHICSFIKKAILMLVTWGSLPYNIYFFYVISYF